ncbi:hypothetical protein GQ607_000194 [Colletotrichum asianum]|uniref:Uncharacterized protein n=1 Tax=Colletotrichum asianum TaxID=702518 RepID=A0A8H3WVH9_9PEZI|nr:hypothetical protein GQ607_000194 [Colletotrichum asianum]
MTRLSTLISGIHTVRIICLLHDLNTQKGNFAAVHPGSPAIEAHTPPASCSAPPGRVDASNPSAPMRAPHCNISLPDHVETTRRLKLFGIGVKRFSPPCSQLEASSSPCIVLPVDPFFGACTLLSIRSHETLLTCTTNESSASSECVLTASFFRAATSRRTSGRTFDPTGNGRRETGAARVTLEGPPLQCSPSNAD